MASWQLRLELGDLWDRWDKGELTTEQVAMETAKRIRALPCFDPKHPLNPYSFDFSNIADDFESVTETGEYNSIMSDLYDLGDLPLDIHRQWSGRKLCWISTDNTTDDTPTNRRDKHHE
ncbi:MAG: hypothetical protein AMS21_00640 [Gemmatimonas sp. SG8_38_2]|nr:MAG: hypothetical protein AMS21_00640 [Gemmatimonas sp. SG8_38_2]